MIGRLRGRFLGEATDGTLVVDVQGVGYEVIVPLGTLGRTQPETGGEFIELWIHTHVREDTLELFGFANELERQVFRLLTSIPNVGPKTAIGVLSAVSVQELSSAIQRGDIARLCKIPGIGKKTAERLLLELKEKLPKLTPTPITQTKIHTLEDTASRLLSALTNMGYRPAEAERAISGLGSKVGERPVNELLREALATLAS